jgi:peptidoglycan/LPS O-acetylase OafA/YrhL
VLAVCAFHETLAQPTIGIERWIRAGYLGVDVFFAISGFLITALLLREAADVGAIRFGAFYLRRARRLVPALATLLVVLAVGALLLQDGARRLATLRHIVVAGTYTTNWFTIIRQHDIHELNHTWSLAIEEQFYLLWPALLTLVLVVCRRRARWVLACVAAIAAVTIAMPFLGTARHWSQLRIYHGLDTRAAALGAGALLGAAFTLGLLPRGRPAAWARRAAGVVGFAVLVAIIYDPGVIKHVLTEDYEVKCMFAIAGVATALVIWELLESRPHAGHRALSWAPLVFVGRISYGVYLWDAVVVTFINPVRRGWLLVIVHLAVTFAAAIASWFLIETRFRQRKPGPAPSGSPVPGG